jgi:hypothetical protein
MRTTARFNKTTAAITACLTLTAAVSLAPFSGQAAAARAQQQVPAGASALIGTWGFTTISGTTYWDKSTGAYRGSGSGGSQSYTFSPNGTYKLFNYVKAGSYGWETQALTWENGKYTVKGDTVTLRPTSGKYQVMDNRVAKNNYSRPMRPAERKVKTFVWSRGEDANNKPVLRLGKSADSLSEYKRAE